jgi:hypothetical protein
VSDKTKKPVDLGGGFGMAEAGELARSFLIMLGIELWRDQPERAEERLQQWSDSLMFNIHQARRVADAVRDTIPDVATEEGYML